MKVGLILDNPKRDLKGNLLVAYHLVKKKHQVFVIPMYQQGYDVPLLNLDIVLLNYARSTNRKLIEGYKRMGIKVAVMDTEGGVLSEDGTDSPEKWAKSIHDSGMYRYIDKYFFWGTKLHEAFKKYSGIDSSDLCVTGCPRYDVSHKKWRPLLNYHRSDYVLINMNFSSVNPKFSRSEKDEIKVFVSVGWDKSYTELLISEMKKVFQKYVSAIKQLAEMNPNTSFLVRPHPFENEDLYSIAYSSISNIFIDGSGDVFNVINNSKFVIHLNCGSAIETRMLGKIPVSMEFLNTDFLKKHTPLPSQISHPANSIDELDQMIKDPENILAKNQNPEIYQACIPPWFSDLDGNASERLSSQIVEIQNKNKPMIWHEKFAYSMKNSCVKPSLFQLIQGIFMNIFGSKLISSVRNIFQPQRKSKEVSIEDISPILDKLLVSDDSRLNLKIQFKRHPITLMKMASIRIST